MQRFTLPEFFNGERIDDFSHDVSGIMEAALRKSGTDLSDGFLEFVMPRPGVSRYKCDRGMRLNDRELFAYKEFDFAQSAYKWAATCSAATNKLTVPEFFDALTGPVFFPGDTFRVQGAAAATGLTNAELSFYSIADPGVAADGSFRIRQRNGPLIDILADDTDFQIVSLENRGLFEHVGCQWFRILDGSYVGSYPGWPEPWDQRLERQDAFQFKRCFQFELGRNTMTNWWGDAYQCSPDIQGQDAPFPNINMAFWPHDNKVRHCGRQGIVTQHVIDCYAQREDVDDIQRSGYDSEQNGRNIRENYWMEDCIVRRVRNTSGFVGGGSGYARTTVIRRCRGTEVHEDGTPFDLDSTGKFVIVENCGKAFVNVRPHAAGATQLRVTNPAQLDTGMNSTVPNNPYRHYIEGPGVAPVFRPPGIVDSRYLDGTRVSGIVAPKTVRCAVFAAGTDTLTLTAGQLGAADVDRKIEGPGLPFDAHVGSVVGTTVKVVDENGVPKNTNGAGGGAVDYFAYGTWITLPRPCTTTETAVRKYALSLGGLHQRLLIEDCDGEVLGMGQQIAGNRQVVVRRNWGRNDAGNFSTAATKLNNVDGWLVPTAGTWLQGPDTATENPAVMPDLGNADDADSCIRARGGQAPMGHELWEENAWGEFSTPDDGWAAESAPGEYVSLVEPSIYWRDITLGQVPPAFVDLAAPDARVGDVYTHRFTTTGTDPVTVTLESGSYPTGLILQTGGMLWGVPSVAGTFIFTLRAANGIAPDAVSPNIRIDIAPAQVGTRPSFVGIPNPPDGKVGESYVPYIVDVDGDAPISLTVETGPDPTTATLPVSITANPIGQNLISTATHQFAVMLTAAGGVRVGKRALGAPTWEIHDMAGADATELGVPVDLTDEHHFPVIAVDGNGRLHVWANMHVDPLRYLVSVDPGEIDNWVVGALPGVGTRITYPLPAMLLDGSMWLLLRDSNVGGPGRSDSHYWRRTAGGTVWTGPTQMFQGVSLPGGSDGTVDDETNYSAYPTVPFVEDRAGVSRIHLGWVWRQYGADALAPGGDAGRTNILPSYAYSDDSGVSWKARDGTALTLPISPLNNPACQTGMVSSGEGYLNGGGVTVDAAGDPHIVMSSAPNYHIYWDPTLAEWAQEIVADPLEGVNIAGIANVYWFEGALWLLTNRVPAPRNVLLIRLDGSESRIIGGLVPSFATHLDPAALRMFGRVEVLVPDGDTIEVFSSPNSQLPPGLVMFGHAIVGTPTLAGTYPIRMRASNGIDPDALSPPFDITIAPADVPAGVPPSFVTPPDPPDGQEGVSYGPYLPAVAGDVPYVLSVESGNFPQGLLFFGHAIVGTPVLAGVYTFTLRLSNGVAPDAISGPITMAVAPATPVGNPPQFVDPPNSVTIKAGVPFELMLNTTGDAPISYYAASGLFPPGVALATSTGRISGTPTLEGNFLVEIGATNGVFPDAFSGLIAFTVTPADPPDPPDPDPTPVPTAELILATTLMPSRPRIPRDPVNRFRFHLGELVTGELGPEVSLSRVRWAPSLNGPGSFEATLSSRVPAAASLEGGRSVLYVTQDGINRLWFAGLVWPITWNRTLRLGGTGLWGYFAHRRIRSTQSFVAADQFEIVSDLLDLMQSEAGHLGLTVRFHPTATTGVARTVEWEAHERITFEDAISQLGELDDGFDFDVTAEWAGTNQISRFLDLWYPGRGRQLGLTWEHGKNCEVVQATQVSSLLANRVDVTGDGNGPTTPIGTATDATTAPRARYDALVAAKDVAEAGRLAALAAAELDRRRVPYLALEINVTGRGDTAPERWTIGDEVWVVAHEGWLSVDGYYRIVDASYDIDDQGGLAIGTVSLTPHLAGDPLRPPNFFTAQRGLSRRLERLERR